MEKKQNKNKCIIWVEKKAYKERLGIKGRG